MDVGSDDGDVTDPMFDAALVEEVGELDADEKIELGVSAAEGTSELLGDSEAPDVAHNVDDELEAVLKDISGMDDDAVVGRLVDEVILRTTELVVGEFTTERLRVGEAVEPGTLVAEGMDGVVELMTTDDTIKAPLVDVTVVATALPCSLAGVVVGLGEDTFVELVDEALGFLVDGEPGRLVRGKGSE